MVLNNTVGCALRTNRTDSLIHLTLFEVAYYVPRASLPGDHRALEPPDPIPNSEVKRRIADGSVGSPHVRVGHRQASKFFHFF